MSRALLVSAIVAFCLGWATVSTASDHPINFQNTHTDTVHTLRVCLTDQDCHDFPFPCGPGSTCNATVDLPDGVYEAVRIYVADDVPTWSDPSQARRRVVTPPLPVCPGIDLDGDTHIGGTDILALFRRYNSRCRNP